MVSFRPVRIVSSLASRSARSKDARHAVWQRTVREHRAAQAAVGYVPLRNMDSDRAEKQMAGEKDLKHPLAVTANTATSSPKELCLDSCPRGRVGADGSSNVPSTQCHWLRNTPACPDLPVPAQPLRPVVYYCAPCFTRVCNSSLTASWAEASWSCPPLPPHTHRVNQDSGCFAFSRLK